MSWLDFVGRIEPVSRYVIVDVSLRDAPVGTLKLTLDQWDDLRGMRDKRDLRWLNVLAKEAVDAGKLS